MPVFYVPFLLFFSREMPFSELKSKYRKVSSIEKARKGWQDEYEASSKQVVFFVQVQYLLPSSTMYKFILNL